MTNRIKQLQEMGFSEKVARKVLAECVWDVNKAIDRLLLEGPPPEEDTEPAGATSAEAAPGGDADTPPPVTVEAWPAVGGKPACIAERPAASSTASTASSPRSSGRKEAAINARTDAKISEAAAVPSTAEAEEDAKSTSAGSHDVAGASSGEDDAAGECASPDRVSDASEATVATTENPAAPEAVEAKQAAPEPAASQEQADEPQKTLERVEKPWQAEDDSQMTVAVGDFVRVWLESKTEHGWIHVESADGRREGWLPDFSLQNVPVHKRWMRALHACEATHDTQMNVEEGSVLLVQIETRTAEDGWVYAEAAPETGNDVKEGWVPVYVLDWTQERATAGAATAAEFA